MKIIFLMMTLSISSAFAASPAKTTKPAVKAGYQTLDFGDYKEFQKRAPREAGYNSNVSCQDSNNITHSSSGSGFDNCLNDVATRKESSRHDGSLGHGVINQYNTQRQ